VAVRAGELRRLFTLEEPSEVVVAGEATIVWTVKGTAWGSLEEDSGTEGRLTAAGTYRIKLRAQSVVTSRWRLGLTNPTRKFNILSPPMDPDGRRRELRILATEILG